jgi:ABC-type dipeptide/oligopeptide/nickel transport system permease component
VPKGSAPQVEVAALVPIPEMELTDNQVRALTSTVPFFFYTSKRPLYTVTWYIGQVVGLLLGIYAAYLSWSCNDGISIMVRVLNALCAFAFGGLYLLMYFIMRHDLCESKASPGNPFQMAMNPVGAPPRFFQ